MSLKSAVSALKAIRLREVRRVEKSRGDPGREALLNERDGVLNAAQKVLSWQTFQEADVCFFDQCEFHG
ncbi:MAG: hypothetical protein NVSMB52_20300 [Chloroflexota bacterium]